MAHLHPFVVAHTSSSSAGCTRPTLLAQGQWLWALLNRTREGDASCSTGMDGSSSNGLIRLGLREKMAPNNGALVVSAAKLAGKLISGVLSWFLHVGSK
jgi:hypothetical protein